MKNYIPVLCAILCALLPCGRADAQELTREQAYVQKYYQLAIDEMRRSGVPASITLAQGLLESGAGYSTLAVKGNNHFGIKCHKWEGRTIRHDDDAPNECFRAYDKPDDSFRDHSDFLRYSDRYKSLFDLHPTDYKGWARGLKAAGYATDPKYADKLIGIIEKYDLSKYDLGRVEPRTPLALEEIHRVPLKYEERYEFEFFRPEYEKNGVPFVYSQKGESYASIARSYELFLKEILSFNDLDAEPAELLPGTIVYLARKKSRTGKGLDKYIVAEDGEDLREISQRFGVKLKSLCKRNGITADQALNAEDEILLR